MDKTKVRVRTHRLRVNDVHRYQVIDHYGRRWIQHREDRANGHYDTYASEYWAGFDDEGIVIEDENKLQYILSITGGSEGEALERHAPLPNRYELLPPDTAIALIRITQLDRKQPDQYYCLEPHPFEDQVARKSDFYVIDELSGRRTLIRYSVITQFQCDVI